MFVVARFFAGLALGAAMLGSLAANAQTFQTLYTFAGPPDGSVPYGVVVDKTSNLYGVTRAGGSTTACLANSYGNKSDGIHLPGCGVLFKIAPGEVWTEAMRYSFTGGVDGAYPNGGGVLFKNGALYGATEFGGTANSTTCVTGCGTVFEFNTVKQKLKTLHTFTGDADSGGPYDGLVFDTNGALYGTVEGGDGSAPVDDLAYKLTPPTIGNTAWAFTALHPSAGGDGEIRSRLVVDKFGNLYGTTRGGCGISGCGCCGTVFELQAPGYNEITLYSFTGGVDGGNPSGAGLAIRYLTSGAFVLYGTTTQGGGASNAGTAFEFDSATQALTTRYTFDGSVDGADSNTALVFRGGALYGAALKGGAHGAGTVFKLATGKTTWTDTLLHTFTGGADGGYPIGPLAFDTGGTLYGTTASGGNLEKCVTKAKSPPGCGTVFEITP